MKKLAYVLVEPLYAWMAVSDFNRKGGMTTLFGFLLQCFFFFSVVHYNKEIVDH
jgi:hypothetical protein